MLPISKELETLDMGCDFDIDKENIPSITLSISMVRELTAAGWSLVGIRHV